MSLPSNSVEQNGVEQNLSDGWSKVGDEDLSTILTDDISQELNCSEEGDEDDRKTVVTVNSSLTKKWIDWSVKLFEHLWGVCQSLWLSIFAIENVSNQFTRRPLANFQRNYYFPQFKQKISINFLSPQEKLDVFKYLNFNQLIPFRIISRDFNNFINVFENELARDLLDISIIDKLAMDRRFTYNSNIYKELNIVVKSINFSLNDDLKKKWELAVSERIPLFLSFNGSCEAVINLHKHRPTMEEWNKTRAWNLLLKLPLFPKNIKEMCIVRYWLERLFRCGYERAEFENIIFNPVLIKLLFENEVKKLYTKQTTLRYCLSKFESEGMKFVKDHLKIFDKFCVEFTLCNNAERFNGIILEILNEGARFPHVCITNHLDLSIVELIKTKITTSTNCVSKIEFKVRNSYPMWNYSYLHKEGVETKEFISSGSVMNFSSYEIANTDNPNIVFSINYFWWDSEDYGGDIDFKIKKK